MDGHDRMRMEGGEHEKKQSMAMEGEKYLLGRWKIVGRGLGGNKRTV